MTKNERKRRLKEKKRRAKEAKKARNAEDSGESTVEKPVEETVEQVRADLGEAAATVREARRIDDARALRMMERAAEVVEDILETTQHALQQVPMEQRLEAKRMLNERQDGAAKGRPRRPQTPVVSLMKMSMQAANLLTRILKITNPDVAKLARAA